MLVYGDAFWPTYTKGDNTGLIATDSMKNFIQLETSNYTGNDLEDYCWFLGATFLETYPQVEGIQVSAVEIPYQGLERGVGFAPSGPERATARVELKKRTVVEVVSGFRGFRLLRLGGSAFQGFVRDEYTTLPDLHDRPLHMWLDLEWSYTSPDKACSEGRVSVAGAPDRARGLPDRRVGKHPAADPSNGLHACWPRSPQSRRSTSRRTTGRGIRLPSAPAKAACIQMRVRRTAVLGLRLRR